MSFESVDTQMCLKKLPCLITTHFLLHIWQNVAVVIASHVDSETFLRACTTSLYQHYAVGCLHHLINNNNVK